MLTNEQMDWIIEQSEKGMNFKEIASQLGVSYSKMMRLFYKKQNLKLKKENAIMIANQLHYSQEIKDMIQCATSENEISRALTTGRNQL